MRTKPRIAASFGTLSARACERNQNSEKMPPERSAVENRNRIKHDEIAKGRHPVEKQEPARPEGTEQIEFRSTSE
jgi:hypothetical protein